MVRNFTKDVASRFDCHIELVEILQSKQRLRQAQADIFFETAFLFIKWRKKFRRCTKIMP
jgi:hypothetical protein